MPTTTVTIKVPAREATDIRNICDEPSNNPVLSSTSASGERAYKTTITLLKYFQIVVQKIQNISLFPIGPDSSANFS